MNQGTITFILPFTHQQHLHMIESGRHKCNDRAQLLIRLTTQIHCTQGQLFTVHKHQGNCSLYTNTRATVHCSLNTNKGHCLLYTNTRATVHFTQTQGPLFTVHKHKGHCSLYTNTRATVHCAQTQGPALLAAIRSIEPYKCYTVS